MKSANFFVVVVPLKHKNDEIVNGCDKLLQEKKNKKDQELWTYYMDTAQNNKSSWYTHSQWIRGSWYEIWLIKIDDYWSRNLHVRHFHVSQKAVLNCVVTPKFYWEKEKKTTK